MTNREGSCLCGGVAYRIEPPYTFFQYCHCQRCRKHSGAAFAANIMLPVAQFKWLKGEDQVRQFELPDARFFCTGFCSVCGSSMPWRTRNGAFFLVPAGTLNEDPGMQPQRSIYWGSKASWYVAPDQLPCFEERKPKGA